ncbi:hypothetical protein GCM10022378_02160 [Salinicoccus jeotgali]|uniref:YdbS-like PH domain-containing protein n=1 Tax=Salinicoccus jeotgali TaxID=381634 RepID=A0ABP7E985_9STAP
MKKVHDEVVLYMQKRYLASFTLWLLIGIAASVLTFYLEWSHWVYFGTGGVLIILLIMGIFIRPFIYRKVTRYEIDEGRLVVKKGFFRIATKMVPIQRVQGAKLATGPISRKHDFAILEVSTASSSMVMPPLKLHEAREMKATIIQQVKEAYTDV